MTLGFITHLIQSYGYYAVFTLIALESMGIPLPGETALITAALYAGTTHHLSITVLAVVAAAAAVIGDNAGYWIGRTGGLRLAERYGRYVRLDRAKLKVGRYLFARHGVKVVFLGRFVAVLRTFAAFFAGAGKMRWPSFLMANAAGGLLWASCYAFGAYALGSAAASVGNTITIVGYAVAAAVTVASIVVARRSLRHLEQRAQETFPDEQAASQAPSDALVASSTTPDWPVVQGARYAVVGQPEFQLGDLAVVQVGGGHRGAGAKGGDGGADDPAVADDHDAAARWVAQCGAEGDG